MNRERDGQIEETCKQHSYVATVDHQIYSLLVIILLLNATTDQLESNDLESHVIQRNIFKESAHSSFPFHDIRSNHCQAKTFTNITNKSSHPTMQNEFYNKLTGKNYFHQTSVTTTMLLNVACSYNTYLELAYYLIIRLTRIVS